MLAVPQGILLEPQECELVAKAIFTLQDLGNRHGARLDNSLLNLAGRMRSVEGHTEPAPTTEVQAVLHERIDTAEAGKILGCSTRNVRRLAARGRIPGEKQGGSWFFNRDDIEVLQQYQ